MKAVTLRHPWPWAICVCGKDVENRTWEPALKQGEWFAIHGGKWPLPIPAEGSSVPAPRSAAVAEYVEEIIDTVKELSGEGLCPGPVVTLRELSRYTGIVAVAQFGGCVHAHVSPWFGGPVGWLLSGVASLPDPIPCRGAQGLWSLPADVESQMRQQMMQIVPWACSLRPCRCR